MVTQKKTKCIICDHRPAITKGLCSNCTSKVRAEERRKLAGVPKYYLTYRGHVVALYPVGGKLKPSLLRRKPDNLPKAKTFDLNKYIQGFTREQVKSFKTCVLKLANN